MDYGTRCPYLDQSMAPFWGGMNTIDSAFQGWGINNWSDIQLPGEEDVRGSLEKRKLNFLPSFGIFDSVPPLIL